MDENCPMKEELGRCGPFERLINKKERRKRARAKEWQDKENTEKEGLTVSWLFVNEVVVGPCDT